MLIPPSCLFSVLFCHTLVLRYLFSARQDSARPWQQRTGRVVTDVTSLSVPSPPDVYPHSSLITAHRAWRVLPPARRLPQMFSPPQQGCLTGLAAHSLVPSLLFLLHWKYPSSLSHWIEFKVCVSKTPGVSW